MQLREVHGHTSRQRMGSVHYCHAIQTTGGELDMDRKEDRLNRNCCRMMEPSWGGRDDMDDDAEMVANMNSHAEEEEDLKHIAWAEANNFLDMTRLSWYLSKQTETVEVGILPPLHHAGATERRLGCCGK